MLSLWPKQKNLFIPFRIDFIQTKITLGQAPGICLGPYANLLLNHLDANHKMVPILKYVNTLKNLNKVFIHQLEETTH